MDHDAHGAAHRHGLGGGVTASVGAGATRAITSGTSGELASNEISDSSVTDVHTTKGSATMLTNVALQSWCGYPKHYHDSNEWLILNYMVRTFISLICKHTCSLSLNHTAYKRSRIERT